jgi:hypothetical protein
MNKEFIPYEQALALKELGFDEPCFGWYEHNGNFYYCYQEGLVPPSPSKKLIKGCCLCPTFSQAFRWFREKGYHCGIIPRYDEFHYFIKDFVNDKEYDDVYNISSYEEAELACLENIIVIVENKID